MFSRDCFFLLDKTMTVIDSQKYCKTVFVRGLRHGLQQGWYKNGQKWYKYTWKNGTKIGIERWWWENGHSSYKCNWNNGNENL